MSEIPYHFPTPIPFYFELNGWFSNNSAGHKNRIFISWAFNQCRCFAHSTEHHGKQITLDAYEFLYTHKKCTSECGLSWKESRRRIDRAIDEKILEKVEERSTQFYQIFRWVPKLMEKRATKNTSENKSKRATKNQKGQPKGQPKEPPDLGEEIDEKEPPKGQPKGQHSYKSYKEYNPPPKVPPLTKEEEEEARKRAKKLIQNIKRWYAKKEVKYPFTDHGVYHACKETDGDAVAAAAMVFSEKDINARKLKLPDRWLLREAERIIELGKPEGEENENR